MSEQALSIVGASRRNGKRDEDDFYPTPSYAVERLLDFESFEGEIWEPVCGDGAISKVLQSRGMQVFSSDLVDRGFGDTHVDFLNTTRLCGAVITNPPFVLAQEFIEHAKGCARNKIAMFLKTTFLEGVRRYPLFKDTRFPLARMYQFCARVKLSKPGLVTNGGGMLAFAWFVWEREHKGPATLEWIPPLNNEIDRMLQ